MTVTIGRPQAAHQPDRPGDRLGDAALLGLGPGMRAGHVDERHDRQAQPLGQLHDPHRLAVALRVRHPEVAPDVLVGVGALLLADDRRPAVRRAGRARRPSPRRRRTAGRRGARRSRRSSPATNSSVRGRCRLRASWTRAQTASRGIARRRRTAGGAVRAPSVGSRRAPATRSAIELRNDSGRKPGVSVSASTGRPGRARAAAGARSRLDSSARSSARSRPGR